MALSCLKHVLGRVKQEENEELNSCKERSRKKPKEKVGRVERNDRRRRKRTGKCAA